MNKQTGDGSIEWRTEARARLLIPGDGGVVLFLAVAGAALLVVPAHPQRAHHRVLGAHRRALHLLSGWKQMSKFQHRLQLAQGVRN